MAKFRGGYGLKSSGMGAFGLYGARRMGILPGPLYYIIMLFRNLAKGGF